MEMSGFSARNGRLGEASLPLNLSVMHLRLAKRGGLTEIAVDGSRFDQSRRPLIP